MGSLELTYICEIVPEKNVCGAIKEYSPHKKYINAAVAKIHKFGMGPFCKFRIPANLNLAGVYAIKVEVSGRQPFYRQFAKLLQPTSLF